MSVFYLVFILLTTYFSFRYDGIESRDSHKQHRLWLMCAYLICLSGFSYGLGGDKFVYMNEFEYYPNSFSEAKSYVFLQFIINGQMPLWTLVNQFVKIVFNSFYALQIVQSVVVNVAVCYLASKYTHRYFLFLLIYFFSLQYFILNTEIMREGFALAFALIGIHEWMNGRKWMFGIFVVIALFFHVSAFMALLFPFIRFKISWKTLIVAFVASFVLWVIGDLLLGKIMTAVLGGKGALVQKIMFYSIHASTIFGFLRSSITFLIFPFIIMYTVLMNEPSEEQRAKYEKLVGYMVVLGIISGSLAGFNRVYNYVQIFYLIMLSEFVYTLFREKKHLIIRAGTLAGTAFLILLMYLQHYETTNKYFYEFYYPYTCILDEDKSVYIREVTHLESAEIAEQDNNVRNIE